MTYNFNNHGIPFLPGYSFRDVSKSAFHRSQTLGYKNGYALPHRASVRPAQDSLLSEYHLTHQDITDLTYGPADQKLHKAFIPAHVTLDKKVLRYYAYFVEDVLDSPEVGQCVRPVVIYYYLVDDSMCIFEPRVQNSGTQQGKRIKRQRFPKNDRGEYYKWKDLNLRMDLDVYGVKYHITQCDAFTKEFMESEGILVNDPEPMPVDSHSKDHQKPQPPYSTPSKLDKLYQFLNMDGKVLRFFALFDDADETRFVKIHYYLVDDTVEITNVQEPGSSDDPFPVLLHRLKIPKQIKKENFPICVMEVSDEEVEYYSPKDFQLGQTINLLGRSFTLYQCDGFTREYYQKNHPDMEMKSVEIPKKSDVVQDRKKVPPYNGFGSLEDSLQNCLFLNPKPPKINPLKKLEKQNQVLRYSARLESPHPEDESRRFILSYYLSDDMISIFEKSSSLCFFGGKFLKKTRVPKPGSTVENPEYYSPADFAIGAIVEVFSHRFVLTDADRYVLTYLESVWDQIPSQTLDSIRQKLDEGTTHTRCVHRVHFTFKSLCIQ
uniref:DM10 domain-containing protein n=1 Tax=Salarias fasciatus TaxID=181472 RepID=A0A672GTH0_SALFA